MQSPLTGQKCYTVGLLARQIPMYCIIGIPATTPGSAARCKAICHDTVLQSMQWKHNNCKKALKRPINRSWCACLVFLGQQSANSHHTPLCTSFHAVSKMPTQGAYSHATHQPLSAKLEMAVSMLVGSAAQGESLPQPLPQPPDQHLPVMLLSQLLLSFLLCRPLQFNCRNMFPPCPVNTSQIIAAYSMAIHAIPLIY